MFWNLIVIALCLLLFFFLIWKEIKRSDKSWLAARIVASVFAVISLFCLAISVTINQKQKTGNSKVAILLTEGFNNDSVQRIVSANRDAKIFTTNKAIKAFNATYITDVTLFTDTDNTKALHIFGYGLDENDLTLLKNTPVIFHPAVIKNSIIAIDWIQKLSPGEPLIVRGSFNNATSSPAKIILTGLNVNLDSVIIKANQISYFQLTATPIHLDKAVYSVTVLSGKDTLENEPIPVEVKTPQPLSILLLAASPDFENKFLKNWLAKNEYKFAVRTKISKNKYDKEYVNISSVSPDRITPSLLEKFDVVIADASELSALPAIDLATIGSYVESKGLGLIVKANSASNSSAFYSKSFPLNETRDSIQHIIKLNLSDTGHTTSPLKIEQPIYIHDVAGTQPLVKDQQMRIVVNSKMYGLGKVILTTITNTYSWQLAGNNNAYNSYWSWLLEKAAKKIPFHEVWNISPVLPQKNEEIHLKLQTVKANIPQVQMGEDIAYMEQNYNLPYEWNATYWPTNTGWQPLIDDEGLTYWWYVYHNKDWKGIKALDRINATKKYAGDHIYKPSKASITSTKTIIEIPKIYFFVIFIICSGFLWFEKKLKEK